MTSTKSHVSQSLNQAAATTGILGAVAFWTLRGARMRRDDLRVALDAIGLGFAMPKDPKTQALLRMAVEHAKKAQPGLVFDRVTQTATEIVYAMSERATDDVTELAQYQHRTRVRLNRTTGALTLEDTQDPALLAVAAKYSDLREWISVTEVGTVLINALRGRVKNAGLCAVNLRGDSGGVYFVPAQFVDQLTALAGVIDGLGQVGALTVWPVPLGDRAATQALTAAKTDFGARMTEAAGDAQALLVAIDADAGTDREESRLLARVAAFAQLRTRIDVYADILGDARVDLLAQIEAVGHALQARLNAQEAAPAAA